MAKYVLWPALLAVPVLMLLSACSAPTVEELKADHKLLADTIHACDKLKPLAARQDIACQNAAKATQEIIRSDMSSFMQGLLEEPQP